MKLNTTKTLSYLGLILVTFVIGYFLVWSSTQEIKGTQKDLLQAELTLQNKEDTLELFKKVSIEYKKNNANIKKLNQLILPEPDPALILIQLEALAAQNKIGIQSINFSALGEETEKGIGIIPVVIEVRGGYYSFKNFLEAIATNLNLMEVQNISLQTERELEKLSGIYTFSLTINVYTESLPEVPPG